MTKLKQTITLLIKRLIKTLIPLLLVSNVQAITIDGHLDDKEWQQVKKNRQFVTVTPYSLNTPEYQTEVQYFSDHTGIYFAITNHQPKENQRSQRSTRDAHMNADYNNIVIDFDNTGLSAYSFTIANGGSIEDGTYRNENNYSYEWNGVWYAKTSADKDHWYVEVHIPWAVAPMANSDTSNRKVGLFVSRNVAHLSKSYADTPIQYNRQRFLSELSTIEIRDYATASLQVFGYASSRSDRVADNTSYDAGLDVFWKPNSHQQLSVTINPDFGQIESDQLVVNFSPTESFFSENRPFFTENQALFDLQGAESLRLIHTRRIGGNPDIGNDLGSGLLGAVKFTSIGEDVNYGFFSAIEDEGELSAGRNYYAGRIIAGQDNYNIGYLLSYTDRPDINRTAIIQAVDYDYKLNADIKLTSQLIHSNISDDEQQQNDHTAWLKAEHQLNNNWAQTLQVSYFGEQFEVNDLGFLPRNNLTAMTYTNRWQNHQFSSSSSIKEHRMNVSIDQQQNNSGLELESSINLTDTWSWKDSSSFTASLTLDASANDDLITRGNNILGTKNGYNFQMTYYSPNQGKFNFHTNAVLFDQAVRGKGYSTHAHSTYYFTDNYSTTLGVWLIQSDDWLLWQQNNQLNSFQQKRLTTRINFNATIDDQQELVVKIEWLALNAKGQSAYQVISSGQLVEFEQPVTDFSVSDTSIQLRYRYEMSPLSNIYLVYSRGGRTTIEDDVSVGSLFSPGWEARDGDNFLVKVRYQF